MPSRSRWKLFSALAAVLVVGVAALCLLVDKACERKEFVGKAEPLSGLRFRFTLSADWKQAHLNNGPLPVGESQSFILPPSLIRQWIASPILHGSFFNRLRIDLLAGPVNVFNGSVQIVDGYPEVSASTPVRI